MRHAVYFAPDAAHPLTRMAAAWLGRDAFADAAIAPPHVAGFAAADLKALTAEPARYGFHGTLVAPFHLAAGRTAGDLDRAAGAFAASHAASPSAGSAISSPLFRPTRSPPWTRSPPMPSTTWRRSARR